ncbi:MAG: ribosome-associated translation inhibitor RaiA [Bryobacterales bacterium]|nr:ribosome-associated translation inhibitor RaiA [Bryobacterales bacterium]
MKINYTGQAAFSPAQQKKLDAKFAKLAKLLDRGGEKGAHVILTTERHLHRAEITVHYYDHPLAVLHSHADQLQAITGAIDKLEKQIVKSRAKWRDTKRRPAAKSKQEVAAPVAAAAKSKAAAPPAAKTAARKARPASSKVFKVGNDGAAKPMTVDEAILEIGEEDYMVYRDAESERLHVLVKRRDGHFDLIES